MTYQEMANKAEAATKGKSWAEAISLWEQVRKEYPNKPQGYNRAAFALRQSGNADGAEALAQKAMELFPKDFGGYFQYAEAAMARKDWGEAVRRWAHFRTKFPEKPQGYSRGGFALRMNDELDAADEMLRQGMELFPQEPDGFIQYGEVAVKRKDWGEAVRRWGVVIEKFPDKPHPYDQAVRALLYTDDCSNAEIILENAMEKFPGRLPKVITSNNLIKQGAPDAFEKQIFHVNWLFTNMCNYNLKIAACI